MLRDKVTKKILEIQTNLNPIFFDGIQIMSKTIPAKNQYDVHK